MGFFSKGTDRWERGPDDIAIRVESSEVSKRWLNRPFVVFDGTVALVFSQGRLQGKLPAGKHDIDGPFRKWLRGDDPTTLVIVDEGDLTLDLNFEQLRTREEITLVLGMRLKLGLSDPTAFYRNVMKDKPRYLKPELQSYLEPELRDALLAFTSSHVIEDLYNKPGLRDEVRDAIGTRVGASLARIGYALVSIDRCEASSSQYDEHRGRKAKVELADRLAGDEAAASEVRKRLRENRADDLRHHVLTKAQFLEAAHQAAHQLGLTDKLREDEYKRLMARLEQDAIDYDRERQRSREVAGVEHEAKIDRIRGESDIERKRDQLKLAEEARASALKTREELRKQDRENERQRIEALERASTSTKAMLSGADAQVLLELEKLEQQKTLSAEQLLALAAEKSEAAASALGQRFAAEGKLNDKVIEQLRQEVERQRAFSQEHAAQLERVMNQALEQMGKVASAKAASQGPGDQTIVTGGAGGPTIINPTKSDTTRED